MVVTLCGDRLSSRLIGLGEAEPAGQRNLHRPKVARALPLEYPRHLLPKEMRCTDCTYGKTDSASSLVKYLRVLLSVLNQSMYP